MENLKTFICICIICSITLTDVSSRAIQSKQTRSIQDSNCGTLKLTRGRNNTIVNLNLLENDIASFHKTYDGYKISNLDVQSGFAFRLCSRILCNVFKATDEKQTNEVPSKLTVVNNLLISAMCIPEVESNEITSCSAISNKLKENECARYYRGKNCDDSFGYESAYKNQDSETKLFNNEVFESMAINQKCNVGLQFNDELVPPMENVIRYNEETKKQDLMSVYSMSQVKAYPMKIQLTCKC